MGFSAALDSLTLRKHPEASAGTPASPVVTRQAAIGSVRGCAEKAGAEA